MTKLAARWLFVAGGPPLGPATLTLDAGRVAAIELRVSDDAEDWLGYAVTPRFVNAHCHLDLTGAAGHCPIDPATAFPDWLASVIAFRRSRTPLENAADVRDGIGQLVAAGTGWVGDIAATPESFALLAGDGRLGGVSFRELIGLSTPRAAAALDSARDWLATIDSPGLVRPGLSPHAPYTAGRALLARAAQFGLPLALHLAESPEEGELLASNTGPFVPFLNGFGALDGAEFAADFAAAAGALAGGPGLLLAHGNFLSPNDVPANASVVYCPRTHAAFGRPRHPVAEMLAAGVRVCLGTDGLSSNPDLDVLAEARWLFAHRPDLGGPALFSMLTEWGADALGLPGSARLTVAANIKLVGVPVDPGEPDPYRALFAPPPGLTNAPRRLL